MPTIIEKAAQALRDANRTVLALQDFTGGATEVLAQAAISAPLKDLDDVIEIQRADGNWNYDAYMFGLMNGLLMARSCLTGDDPGFLKAPDTWLADLPEASAPAEVHGAMRQD